MFRSIGTSLRAGAAAFLRALPTLLRDAVGLASVAAIAYGAWLIAPAAGFITGGALVLIGVVLISQRGAS